MDQSCPVIRFASKQPQSAFTLIEIALSLAVIGFALVAIIGVLPFGMNVQKENRQETIVCQDATLFMEAIRGGARGFDDLTNYVVSITNSGGFIDPKTGALTRFTDAYTPTVSLHNGTPTSPPYPLTNGAAIIGLLSKPRIETLAGTIVSNHITAVVRSISGAAVNKPPQNNQVVLDNAFTYRLIVDITDYVPVDPISATNVSTPQGASNVKVLANLLNNTFDMRLSFRWPVYPNGDVGVLSQNFRTMLTGHPASVNVVPTWSSSPTAPMMVYYYQPGVYARVP